MKPQKAAPFAGLLLSALLLASCSPESETKANDLDAAPPKTTTLSVRTVTAQTGTLTAQRSASATIQAERDSQVATQSSGTVQSIPVSQGEAVARGDVLVKLDDTGQQQALENARLQLRQAQIGLTQTQQTTTQATGALQASVTSAQAALAQAEQSAQSAEKLYDLGGISLADLQAARSQLAQAQSQLAQARNALDQNGRSAQNSVPLSQVQLDTAQAAVRQAEENLRRTAVRAPFAGTVADVLTEVGEFAGQGTPVVRLVDPGSVRARVGVPTADAAALTEGVKFNLTYGGKSYVATVVDSSGIAGQNRLVPITRDHRGRPGVARRGHRPRQLPRQAGQRPADSRWSLAGRRRRKRRVCRQKRQGRARSRAGRGRERQPGGSFGPSEWRRGHQSPACRGAGRGEGGGEVRGAEGRRRMAEGRWQMADGGWPLALHSSPSTLDAPQEQP